jgi:hypothetical protein
MDLNVLALFLFDKQFCIHSSKKYGIYFLIVLFAMGTTSGKQSHLLQPFWTS